jgi:hypothetical protein
MNLKVLPADEWRIHTINPDVIAISAHSSFPTPEHPGYRHWIRIETSALAEWLSVWTADDGDSRPSTPKDICPA